MEKGRVRGVDHLLYPLLSLFDESDIVMLFR